MINFNEVAFETVGFSNTIRRSPVSRMPDRWINHAPTSIVDTDDWVRFHRRLTANDRRKLMLKDRIHFDRRRMSAPWVKGCTPDHALVNVLQAGEGVLATNLQKFGVAPALYRLEEEQSVHGLRSARNSLQIGMSDGWLADAYLIETMYELRCAMQMYGPVLITVPWWTSFEKLTEKSWDSLSIGGKQIGLCSFSVCGFAGNGLIWELSSNFPGWGNVYRRVRVTEFNMRRFLESGEFWAVKRSIRNGGNF